MPYHDTLLPGNTWSRAVRRAAGTLGAAVVLAGVVPALANAAGADVANPVGMALRASGERIASALGADADCEVLTPVASGDATGTPSEAPSPADCSDDADHGKVVSTVAHCAPRGDDPLLSTEGAPSTHGEYVTAAAHGDELETPWGTFDLATAEGADALCAAIEAASASASPSPSETETESEESDDEANHGKIVSTVAKCAPKGKDPLLSADGAPRNHGAYVKVAAHGETLDTPWGSFDLSTLAGAEQLCAALDAARATASPEPKGKDKADKAKKGKGARGRPAEAGKGD